MAIAVVVVVVVFDLLPAIDRRLHRLAPKVVEKSRRKTHNARTFDAFARVICVSLTARDFYIYI